MVRHNYAFSDQHRPKCSSVGPSLFKTWFNQPARKFRRRQARKAKAIAMFPRPVNSLRPAVTGCTQKYNLSDRLGRGFSTMELKAAGLTVQNARQIGISVDTRRKNKSQESLSKNTERLQAYLKNLVVFPKGKGVQGASQVTGSVMPLETVKPTITTAAVADMPSMNVFWTIRHERSEKSRMKTYKAHEKAKAARASKGGKKGKK
eukprot:gnl/Dysnectes_brevis/448_a498_9680.p1 GENE.gnl/Dysnectes_brevis/448_a498_9680~~gnl/Dysnectes_brevis/448_a498_9680.p1  ORF type:complete len:205 (+),score=67.12 gnl/Dysnectes_brevis/448_a498_9680:56-670(+)